MPFQHIVQLKDIMTCILVYHNSLVYNCTFILSSISPCTTILKVLFIHPVQVQPKLPRE